MWLALSLTNAVVSGLQNAYYKRASIQINPVLMVWSILVVSGLLFSPLLLLGIPKLNNLFWIAVFGRLIIDSFTFTLFLKGVQMAPLSLTIPMTSLVPLMSIGTVFFINHQAPSALGVVGVIITVVGIYFLHFDRDTKHILSPFKAIMKERGVMYCTISALLWSFVVSLQKLGIDNSNINFYTAFFQIFWAICFTPVAFLVDRKGFLALFKPSLARKLIPAGALDAIQVYAQFSAYLFANPVYVLAVTNTNILFSSFFGWYFYKEKVHKHLLPILIIVVGIVVISLAK